MAFPQSYSPYPDKDTCVEVISKAVDLNVTLFNTAQVYTMGLNEKLVGEALHPLRDKVVIATKFGYDLGHLALDESNRPTGLSSQPEVIRHSVEDSLHPITGTKNKPSGG